MFIGFTQIFSYYALKLNKVTRAIIGLVIIFSSDSVRQFLFQGKEAGDLLSTVLHFIIISPSPMTPLLPWISICFISSIFGEYLYEAMIGGTKKDYRKLFRIFLYWGVSLVLVGIFIGRNSYIPGTDFTISTLPLSEYPHLLLLADMRTQMNNFISMLSYYGKVSLSLFLLHFIFLSLFFQSLDIFGWVILLFSYLGFWGFIMYVWNEFYNGVGSPEWLMVQVGRIGQKTSKTVKKEILIIEKEVKETVHKLKHERDKGSEG
jgi:uncharacterized membrane protein